jgi:phage gp37-like protein
MLSRIEAAMAAHLAGAKLPYLRTVATYGGEFDEGLPGVVRQLPAVWLMFRGKRRRAQGHEYQPAHLENPGGLLVMCGTRDLRG